MPERDVLAAVIATLQAPVAVGDRAVARALAQLEREAHRRRWRQRVSVGALAAGLLLATGLWSSRATTREPPLVRFAVAAPGAGRVALIGDFNDWDPAANPLRRRADEWSVTLRLKPGRYRYAFVLDDGRWVADPVTPVAEDEFGAPTSAITISN